MKYEDIKMYKDIAQRYQNAETVFEKQTIEYEFEKFEHALLQINWETFQAIYKLITLSEVSQRIIRNAVKELYEYETLRMTTLVELIDKAKHAWDVQNEIYKQEDIKFFEDLEKKKELRKNAKSKKEQSA